MDSWNAEVDAVMDRCDETVLPVGAAEALYIVGVAAATLLELRPDRFEVPVVLQAVRVAQRLRAGGHVEVGLAPRVDFLGALSVPEPLAFWVTDEEDGEELAVSELMTTRGVASALLVHLDRAVRLAPRGPLGEALGIVGGIAAVVGDPESLRTSLDGAVERIVSGQLTPADLDDLADDLATSYRVPRQNLRRQLEQIHEVLMNFFAAVERLGLEESELENPLPNQGGEVPPDAVVEVPPLGSGQVEELAGRLIEEFWPWASGDPAALRCAARILLATLWPPLPLAALAPAHRLDALLYRTGDLDAEEEAALAAGAGLEDSAMSARLALLDAIRPIAEGGRARGANGFS